MGLGGFGLAWCLLAVNSAPSVCVGGGVGSIAHRGDRLCGMLHTAETTL